ncbi:hypothetical protein GJ744_004271 [Endocarpon pusillum]|uniref:Ankyrin n=1 Tax=Endocarpon pusillum TaxID=364733 RepID=A0A8H7A833_9EURO|nr:hypothetical protein GJ744_004271 [Endocarpon pusillum]
MKELETTYGKFIMTTKRRQWSADREASHEGTTNSKATGELTATWKAILDHERFQANITVYLHQITRADGFSSLYPSILVGRIRPDDSPIFSFVHDGNMDGLLSLLSQGKASLRDCNSFGTPLLHYATRQPEMCKFLIENGADVDEYAPFPSQYTPFLSHEDGVLELVSGPPLAFQWWRYAEGGSKSYECQRLLLNAGADPEANTGSANSTFGLQFVIDTGTIESLQLILDLGTSFIDLERKDEWGDTPLLRLAMMSDVECKPAKYDLLLTRGADIKARNNKGKNCLHILMESVFDCESSDEQEALVLLIRKGADVNAVDNFGDSIAKTAYSHEGVYDHLNTYDLGMYRGDLWDAVLSDCGYDIAEMRKGFPRRPRYSCDYTREGFERLWRGREEFCPYYDDPSEWDPEKDLESLTDSKEGISENGSEGEGLQDYSGYGVDNNEEDTQLELPPLRDNGEASVFLTQSLPPYHDIPAVWNREGEIESIERSEECPREGISANRDLQAGSGYDMDTDEGGTEHELPPLRSNEEGNMLSREPLPLLSSIDGATLETSTIEPATSSCWYPDSSQTMVPRNHFQQVSVESNISESVPIWQDWPTTIQTTFPAHSFQRGFVGAVSELEDCELEESNPIPVLGERFNPKLVECLASFNKYFTNVNPDTCLDPIHWNKAPVNVLTFDTGSIIRRPVTSDDFSSGRTKGG